MYKAVLVLCHFCVDKNSKCKQCSGNWKHPNIFTIAGATMSQNYIIPHAVISFKTASEPIKFKVSLYDNIDHFYSMSVPEFPILVSLLSYKQIYAFFLIISYKL